MTQSYSIVCSYYNVIINLSFKGFVILSIFQGITNITMMTKNMGQSINQIDKETSQVKLILKYPLDTQKINLNSTCPQKIYSISQLPLSNFTSLTSLILSNNMISSMQPLALLTNLHSTLQILNLEFNNIHQLQALHQFISLQQLYLSYNDITTISTSFTQLSNLKVLHLAFNSLHIDQLTKLIKCQTINVLSLHGNPLIEELSYKWVIKLSMKNLKILDEKDCYEQLSNTQKTHNSYEFMGSIQEKEEIGILRETVSKLLEEKQFILKRYQQLQDQNQKNIQHYKTTNYQKIKKQQQKLILILRKKAKIKQNRILEIIQVIKDIKVDFNKQYGKKQQTQNFSDEKQSQRDLPLKSSGKYRIQQQQPKYHQVYKDKKKNKLQQQQKYELLQLLKQKQQQLTELRLQVMQLRKSIKIIEEAQYDNIYEKTLLKIIKGGDLMTQTQISRQELVNCWSNAMSLPQQIRLLKQIVFGEQQSQLITITRLINLKQYLKDKCLIEIISELRSVKTKQKLYFVQYQRQRQKFIKQFGQETNQLCKQWKYLNQSKQVWFREKKIQQDEFDRQYNQKITILSDNFNAHQQKQQRQIQQLNLTKQNLQERINELKVQLSITQSQFQSKLKQLQQFQQHFEQFKQDKQTIRQMRDQMMQIQSQLKSKEKILQQTCTRVKQYELQDEILSERVKHLQKLFTETEKQIQAYQQRLTSYNIQNNELKEKEKTMIQECEKAKQILEVLREANKEQEKLVERGRKNIQICQDKLKNLTEIQTSKKSTIIDLQNKIQEINRQYRIKKLQEEQIQLILIKKKKQLNTYLLKINQNKVSLQSLRDINHSISEMMNRQRQLKCSIIQLQVENKTLLQQRQLIINEGRSRNPY